MKSLKKILAFVLSMVLVAGISVSGTVAYLSKADADVNVMASGNVDIKQHEYQRATNDDGTYKTDTIDNQTSYVLEAFQQGKPLLPATELDANGNPANHGAGGWDATTVRMSQVNSYGGMTVFTSKNAVDKFVVVENTGNTDAYIRTLVAIEIGEADADLFGISYHSTWSENEIGVITIDGNKYFLYEFAYEGGDLGNGTWRHKNGILPAGETAYPSLSQVYLNAKATNEDVEKIDGNGNGTIDILVLSQAVQASYFDNAETALNAGFGAVNAANAAVWFGGVEFPVLPVGYEVNNSEELAAAVAAGETEIWLNPGTYQAPNAAQGKTLTINGTKASVLEVIPVGQGEANGQLDYSFDGSTVTFNGITIKTNSQLYAGYARLSGTYNDCVIQNTYNLGVGNSAFYNCEINISNEYLRVAGATSAVFDGCTFNTAGRAILVYQDGTNVAQTVTVKDCTFNATAAANTWNGIHVAAVSIDGTNGTYTVNLEGTNTVDSDFNGLWQIKAGETNVTVNG